MPHANHYERGLLALQMAALGRDARTNVQQARRIGGAALAGWRAYHYGAGDQTFADQVTDAWNALRNEVHGTGSAPRPLATEAQRAEQARILEVYTRFRDFRENSFLSSYPAAWRYWQLVYGNLRADWAAVAGTTQTPEAPEHPGAIEDAAREYRSSASQSSAIDALRSNTGTIVLSALGGAAAATAAIILLARAAR